MFAQARYGTAILLAIFTCGFFASASIAGGQRIMPPESVKCPHNNLTVYEGAVLSFSRRRGRTDIRIRTDWNTTEKVTLTHAGTDDAREWFLLRGEPFKQGDWAVIETSRNRLRQRMRANVWVCDDGTNAIIDWRPPTD